MSSPDIKLMRENHRLQSNWEQTRAYKTYYLYYKEIPSGGVAQVHRDLHDYLLGDGMPVKIVGAGTLIFDRIPVYHSDHTYLGLMAINIEQEGQEPKFKATVEYGTEIGKGGGFNIPPWFLPWSITTNFATESYVPTHADIISVWNNTGSDPNVPRIGVPLLNSAGGGFDQPPEESLYIGVLQLSGARNPEYGLLSLVHLAEYIGSINTLPVTIAGSSFSAFTCKIKNMNTSSKIWTNQQTGTDVPYQDVSIEIEVKLPNWFRTVIDQGPFWKDETSEDGRRLFTAGEEITDIEDHLNGFGKPRGWVEVLGAVDPDVYDAEGPTFIQFNTYTGKDFNELYLPKDASGWL